MTADWSVFPAHAGMFPAGGSMKIFVVSFPRARGDVPCPSLYRLCYLSFSPRTRGCSYCSYAVKYPQSVFPAHAGMFPSPHGLWNRQKRFPRARGDVPFQ